MLSLIVVSAVFAPAIEPLPPALKELQGDWRAVAVEEKGKAWGNKEEVAEVVLEIAGDTLTFKRSPAQVEKFRATLDPKKKPAWIDLRLIDKDADPAKACHAIYALDGGRLKLCLHSEFTPNDPKERPEEFTTGNRKPAQGQLLFVMERVKR